MARKPSFWRTLSLTVGLALFLTVGLASQARAQYNGSYIGPSTFGRHPGPYLPDGPYVPTVTETLGNEGAAGLPPDVPAPPQGFDRQSIWNMRVVGFNDNQGRASSDDGWIEDQNGRYIAYVANSPGSAPNPQNGVVEQNGTSLIDVTNPAYPVYVHHIPSIFPATMSGGSGKTNHLGLPLRPFGVRPGGYLQFEQGSRGHQIWGPNVTPAQKRIKKEIEAVRRNGRRLARLTGH